MERLAQIIEACEEIEKDFEKYRLWENPTPNRSGLANLKKILPNNDWDILRKAVYKKNLYKCKICDKANTVLYAHEEWKYIYEKSIQQLRDIIPLCNLCYLHKHLGWAIFKIQNKELDEDQFVQHWCILNNEQDYHFEEYMEIMYKFAELRNEINWIVIECSGREITKNSKLEDVIKCI